MARPWYGGRPTGGWDGMGYFRWNVGRFSFFVPLIRITSFAVVRLVLRACVHVCRLAFRRVRRRERRRGDGDGEGMGEGQVGGSSGGVCFWRRQDMKLCGRGRKKRQGRRVARCTFRLFFGSGGGTGVCLEVYTVMGCAVDVGAGAHTYLACALAEAYPCVPARVFGASGWRAHESHAARKVILRLCLHTRLRTLAIFVSRFVFGVLPSARLRLKAVSSL